MQQAHVLLYPCNVVGFIRLAMLAVAILFVSVFGMAGWEVSQNARLAIAAWLLFCVLILDLADGYLARKLGHATQFGALFDLAIDLLNHTFVWILSGLAIAPLFIALEWTTGLFIAAFATRPTKTWKAALVDKGPWLLRIYWHPIPGNPLAGYSNVAHFVFPLSLYVFGAPMWLTWPALPGLIIFELVTVYMLYTFIKILVAEAHASM